MRVAATGVAVTTSARVSRTAEGKPMDARSDGIQFWCRTVCTAERKVCASREESDLHNGSILHDRKDQGPPETGVLDDTDSLRIRRAPGPRLRTLTHWRCYAMLGTNGGVGHDRRSLSYNTTRSILPKHDGFPGLAPVRSRFVTRVHLKRTASDNLALCGIRPRESFKLIDELSKFTQLESAAVCKICLKAANGVESQSSSGSSRS